MRISAALLPGNWKLAQTKVRAGIWIAAGGSLGSPARLCRSMGPSL